MFLLPFTLSDRTLFLKGYSRSNLTFCLQYQARNVRHLFCSYNVKHLAPFGTAQVFAFKNRHVKSLRGYTSDFHFVSEIKFLVFSATTWRKIHS